MRQPVPPTDVRLRIGDQVIPVECTYEGWHEGRHVWVSTAPAWVERGMEVEVLVGEMPGRTELRVQVEGPS